MNYKKEEIIDEVVKLRLKEMRSTKEILDYIMKKWGYGQTFAYDILRNAQQKIKEHYQELNNSSLEEAIGQLENMASEAKNSRNYKLAFEIRKELSKIQGHYVEKLHLSGNIDHTIQVIKLNGPNEGIE